MIVLTQGHRTNRGANSTTTGTRAPVQRILSESKDAGLDLVGGSMTAHHAHDARSKFLPSTPFYCLFRTRQSRIPLGVPVALSVATLVTVLSDRECHRRFCDKAVRWSYHRHHLVVLKPG